jgi:hypothetical protein
MKTSFLFLIFTSALIGCTSFSHYEKISTDPINGQAIGDYQDNRSGNTGWAGVFPIIAGSSAQTESNSSSFANSIAKVNYSSAALNYSKRLNRANSNTDYGSTVYDFSDRPLKSKSYKPFEQQDFGHSQ